MKTHHHLSFPGLKYRNKESARQEEEGERRSRGCITFVYARIDCHSQNPETIGAYTDMICITAVHIITYYYIGFSESPMCKTPRTARKTH